MALDDRDWYRDEVRKRTNYTEKADFRRSLENPEVVYDPKLYREPPRPPVGQAYAPRQSVPSSHGWHWSIQFLFWAAMCLILYGAFWVLNDYQQAKRQAKAATEAASQWKVRAETAEHHLRVLVGPRK